MWFYYGGGSVQFFQNDSVRVDFIAAKGRLVLFRFPNLNLLESFDNLCLLVSCLGSIKTCVDIMNEFGEWY